ncbi:MAG: DUF177 domain-containing protein [Propionibacteriaceae bacterium]|jgi:uncharacterized protein|nr:DUF177 domain-containing protein [Propionibacteriaceae bacterium]
MPGHLDESSPLVINTHGLRSSKQVRRIASAPDGLGIAMIGVPPDSPIEFEVLLEPVGEGVLVTGSARVSLRGSCSRCLEPVEAEASVELQELYSYHDIPDASRLEGELINLEPLLRDQVVLEMPFTPLCQPDCAGLCPDCGANLNRDPGHGHAPDIDPRWSGLQGFDGFGKE